MRAFEFDNVVDIINYYSSFDVYGIILVKTTGRGIWNCYVNYARSKLNINLNLDLDVLKLYIALDESFKNKISNINCELFGTAIWDNNSKLSDVFEGTISRCVIKDNAYFDELDVNDKLHIIGNNQPHIFTIALAIKTKKDFVKAKLLLTPIEEYINEN